MDNNSLNSPTISVIIPVKNNEEYLQRCVESILNQTYNKLEIILITDPYSICTNEICKKLEQEYSNINLLECDNLKISTARNIGLNNAKGKYISFVNSDDFLHPQAYALAINTFNANFEIDFVEWEYQTYSDELLKYDFIEFDKADKTNIETHNNDVFVTNLITNKKYKSIVTNKLFSKNFIDGLNFLDNDLAEDLFFINNYIEKVKNIAYIPSKLHFYYQNVDIYYNFPINIKSTSSIDALYQRHLIIIKLYENEDNNNYNYINLSIENNLKYIDNMIWDISRESVTDTQLQKNIVSKMIKYYYDEVINSKFYENNWGRLNIRRDFIIAKQDIDTFLYNHDSNKIKVQLKANNPDNTDLISVIVPVYNVENYLELCVLSIINQTYKNLEIILVDDGSTDNSGSICDELATKYSNIIVIHKKNGGLSSARNTGMKIANGTYISFIDSDDYIHPQVYSLAINTFNYNNDLDFVEWAFSSFYNEVSEYNTIKFNKITDLNIEISDRTQYIISIVKPYKHTHVAWNKLFKKDFIAELSFIDGIFAEDLFFTNDFMLKVNSVAYIYIPLYFYYRRNGSIMNSEVTTETIVDLDGYFDRYNIVKENYVNLVEITLSCILNIVNLKLMFFKKFNDYKETEIIEVYVNNMIKYFYDDIINSNQIQKCYKNDFILAKNNVDAYITKQFYGEKCDCDECKSGRYNPKDYIITEKDFTILDKERPLGLTGHLRVKDEALTIGECIESCIDFLDELIITYNDSTDGTEGILEACYNKYPDKIKLYHYKPFVAPAREYTKYTDIRSVHNIANYYNYGYVKTNYKYYMKIDGDQIYFTSKLVELREKLISIDNLEDNDELSLYIKEYSNKPELFGFRLGGINLTENIETLEVNILEKPFNGCVGDHVIWIPNSKTKYYYDEEKMWETFLNPTKLMNYGFAWLHFGFAKRLMQGVGIQLCHTGYPLESFANLTFNELLNDLNLKDVIKNTKNYYYKPIYNIFLQNWWDNDRKYIFEVLSNINIDKMRKILEKHRVINPNKSNDVSTTKSEISKSTLINNTKFFDEVVNKELQVIIWGNERNAMEITSKIRINEVLNRDIKIVAICSGNIWLHGNFFYISLRGSEVEEIPFISPEKLIELINKNNNYCVILGQNDWKYTSIIHDKLANVGINKVIPMNIVSFLMQNSLSAVRIFNLKNEALILCSPMKTGNITIETTLPKNNIDFVTLIHKPQEFKWFNKYSKVKVITAIREPISQALSVIYQILSAPYENEFYKLMKELFDNKEHFLSSTDNIYPFLDKYINERTKLSPSYYIDSFFCSFKENILDLSQYSFDKEKGYSIVKEGNIEVFVYQLEKMNDIVTEMSDWIGETSFDTWVRANEAAGKWIGEHYKQVQKEIKLPKTFFDECYDDPWIQHFYSQEDIEKFKERWRPHIV